jgi:hypothetical protein
MPFGPAARVRRWGFGHRYTLGEQRPMVTPLPWETIGGAFELMCYFFTALGAALSYLLSLRW